MRVATASALRPTSAWTGTAVLASSSTTRSCVRSTCGLPSSAIPLASGPSWVSMNVIAL